MKKKLLKLFNVNMLHGMALIAFMCGCSVSLYSQGKVTGKVSDESGVPLAGVSVVIKGTNVGVSTDTGGNYSINSTGASNVLVFSLMGFTPQEITVGTKTSINVSLAEGATELEEVVVTAMGITREARKVGYAVTTIKASDITRTGSTNFATALYGKASGVRIQNTQGGAAGGVSINVRGVSSLNGNNQPLVVLNGVPIRNGNASTNSTSSPSGNIAEKDFSSIGTGNRVRSNGLVDINPEDIESLSILKGAAATALYGSEAANGAIIITSKKASNRGVTIDASLTYQINMIANVPPIQSKYGPGPTTSAWKSVDGFIQESNGKRPEYVRSSWGPEYNNKQDVLYIDGKTRKYSVIDSEPWKKLFGNGSDQIYNVAINQGGENSSTRFSYTYVKETPNALTGDYQKHNFNVVGNLKFNDKLSLDYTGNYISQHFVNRAAASLGIYGGYDESFGSFLDIDMMKKMYKNSFGYKNSEDGNKLFYTLDKDPNFKFGADRAFARSVADMLWGIYENNNDELEQRLIASMSPTWKILPYLTAKAHISTDYTTDAIEDKNRSSYPASIYASDVNKDVSGSYGILRKSYQVVYGDAMLFLDKQLTETVNLTASFGWQGRSEEMKSTSVGTNGGLAIDNGFTITNSKKPITAGGDADRKMSLLKTAWLGSLGVSYGDFIFVDFTGRWEKSSTLPRGARDYFYPSASASFLYTEAFKDILPSWYKYGKLRFSYGIVGNAPEAYAARMDFDSKTDQGGLIINNIPGALGNNNLKPETTKEFEIGIENKLFDNRAGFEVSYYRRDISDMLLSLPLPQSSGAGSVWSNSGTMINEGFEFMLYGDIIQTKNFTWTVRANAGLNNNTVKFLADGVPYLGHGLPGANAPGLGESRSYAGRSMGDWVVTDYTTVTDQNSPHYGKRIVSADGNYVMSSSFTPTLNAMPKLVGGLGMSFYYKNIALDVMSDFRFGGYVFNYMYWNTMAMGVNKQTENRDGKDFKTITYENGVTRKNGIVLDGVVEDGNGGYVKNEKAIAYDSYIGSAYGVGGPGTPNQTMLNGLFKNSWWKLREVALTYSLPKELISKISVSNLSLSVFGRNLFYFTKSIPDYDPETSNSTDWKSQLVIGGSASPARTVGVSLRVKF